MAYEPKDMTITLFSNKKREKEGDPNATGSGLVDGRKVWASAWTNTSKSGEKYQKISIKWADERAQEITDQVQSGSLADELGDSTDVPF